jgi:Chemoreceptor zinc-binding domain
MSVANIDHAILAHKNWVIRFRNVINGGNEEFTLATAKDDTACAFGQWLYSDSDTCFQVPATKDTIIMIHRMFHEIAGEVVQQIQADKNKLQIKRYVHELENLSDQLVGLLQHEKSKLLAQEKTN